MKKFPTSHSVLSGMALLLSLAGCATFSGAPVEINLVAINDFHGHLDGEKFSYTSANDKVEHAVFGGGIDNLGAAIQAWRAEDKELVLVGSGDLVSASPALSAMWADEPSIEALNLLGMRVSSVGNHEFDNGRDELLRLQNGGCASSRPDQACKFRPQFSGAGFTYLAANVIDTATGKPFMPAYRIEQAHGVKIGFIGAVLADTPVMVQASGIKGLRFTDEAEAINRWIPELKAQGVTVFVVLIHEGGETTEYFDQPDCAQLRGPIVGIARRLDPAIKLVISGHTHHGYLCKVDGRTVTQAEKYGHMLSRLTLSIDPVTREVRDIRPRNALVTASGLAPNRELDALLKEVKERSNAELTRPIARLALPIILRKQSPAGESALGDLVADAQFAAVRKFGVQIVFMNSKGIRGDLAAGPDGVSNFSQNAGVLPFGNTLVLMTLTGAQIRALLEQQVWLDEEATDGRNVLQVSDGFTYAWDSTRPIGQRVVPGSIMLNGRPLEDAAQYRIAANNFIADGGDRVPMFKNGTDRVDTGIKDRAAMIEYLSARDRAGNPAGSGEPAGRIRRIK